MRLLNFNPLLIFFNLYQYYKKRKSNQLLDFELRSTLKGLQSIDVLFVPVKPVLISLC